MEITLLKGIPIKVIDKLGIESEWDVRVSLVLRLLLQASDFDGPSLPAELAFGAKHFMKSGFLSFDYLNANSH